MVPREADVMAQKDKKKKKSKKQGTIVAIEDIVPDQSLLRDKKRKKRKDSTDAITPAAGADAAAPTVGKQKKKNKSKASTGVDDAMQLQADLNGVTKHKKTKKQKLGHDSQPVSAPPSGVAATAAQPICNGDATTQQAEEWQRSNSITVEGCSVAPVLAFDKAGFCSNVQHATRDFAQPSPIQSQCWPIILMQRDLVGIAATGSGKTLAFGLPALQGIVSNNKLGVRVSVLVLAPTRELALQTSSVMEEAGKPCGVSCVCIYGGVPKRDQIAAVKQGAQIVCGTPGRIQDLMEDGSLNLSNVDYLVLDEADRMLDLGFEPSVRAIVGKTKSSRQTLMFSATWPTAVQKLASEFLRTPVKVTVGSKNLSANHSVKQVVEVIEQRDKEDKLLNLLNKYHSSRNNRVIIFVLYKKEATRMESFLTRKGWKVAAVHGDLNQSQRTQAVNAFKAGTSPLLLATDVAARGLDIPDVEVVINFSFPLTTEDYVHRIGRTGRAGKTGISHTLFCGQTDKPRAGELINVLREANQPVPSELLKFGTTVKKKESKLYGAHFKDVDVSQKATKVVFDSDSE